MSVYIYKIFNDTHCYIGSTINMKGRMAVHETKSYKTNRCSSKIIIDTGKYEVEILEECNISNRKEREQYYIDNNVCVNKFRANGHVRTRNWEDKYEKEYKKKQYQYKRSWGGDKRYNNNLLEIDCNLFL